MLEVAGRCRGLEARENGPWSTKAARWAWKPGVSVGESACVDLSSSLGEGHGEKETGGEGHAFLSVPALALPDCPDHQRTHAPRYRNYEIYKLAGERNICMRALGS
jgi:hypothetical protein